MLGAAVAQEVEYKYKYKTMYQVHILMCVF